MDKYWQIFYLGQNLGVSFQVEHFFGSNRTLGQKFDKIGETRRWTCSEVRILSEEEKKLVFPEKLDLNLNSCQRISGRATPNPLKAVSQAVEN